LKVERTGYSLSLKRPHRRTAGRSAQERRDRGGEEGRIVHARERGWYQDRPLDAGLLDYVREMTYALDR
jgi:hypothetical protein